MWADDGNWIAYVRETNIYMRSIPSTSRRSHAAPLVNTRSLRMIRMIQFRFGWEFHLPIRLVLRSQIESCANRYLAGPEKR